MFQNLMVFQTAAEMAKHAGARQAVVTRNIANADTPGFQAQHIPSFKDSYRAGDQISISVTRAGHMTTSHRSNGVARSQLTQAEASPNGNTVSLEDEILSAVEVSREHSRALAIYRHAMTVIRATISR
jgi:flagellar basal-body rod protein FlgB